MSDNTDKSEQDPACTDTRSDDTGVMCGWRCKSHTYLSWVYRYTREGCGGIFEFVSGKMAYFFVFDPYACPEGHGEIFTYVVPTEQKKYTFPDEIREVKTIVEFTKETVDEVIETLCLDGTPLKTILNSTSYSIGNYTSYLSEESPFSIRDDSLSYDFEYNGLWYRVTRESGLLNIYGPRDKYRMPLDGGTGSEKRLVEFKPDQFELIVKTFEIDGHSIEWILDHQYWWKYQFDANHLVAVLRLSSLDFGFIYRRTPFYIPEWDVTRDGVRKYYIYIWYDDLIDVGSLRPLRSWRRHWIYELKQVVCGADHRKSVRFGPFVTIGELLDKVVFGERTLREIFDTEYDDGEVLCGAYNVCEPKPRQSLGMVRGPPIPM